MGNPAVADFLAGLRVFEEFQRLGIGESAEIVLSLTGVARTPDAEFCRSVKARRTGRHPLRAELYGVPLLPDSGRLQSPLASR